MAISDSGLHKLVGRTITHVLVKAGQVSPKSQVFLVLDDGTYFEFYGDTPIRPTGDVRPGGLHGARAYMAPHSRIIYEV
jgi:hypothetical protein